MKHFVDAYLAGKPIIGLRTSTHAFSYGADSKSPYAKFSWDSTTWPGGFGKQVLGETWVSHHGAHKKEAARGIIEPSAVGDPLLRGVSDLFGNADVYTANPPPDVKILVRGQVVAGMLPTDPGSGRREKRTDATRRLDALTPIAMKRAKPITSSAPPWAPRPIC